jgi:hypothetical protein
MDSYRVVALPTRRWAVEWLANGTPMGLTFGKFDAWVAAVSASYDLALMDMRQQPDA